VFYRDRDGYRRRWSDMPIVSDRRFAFLVYPLTGGFTRPPLLQVLLYAPLHSVERMLQPLAPLLAFRCLVVLERR
jgi:hypothetical protein